MRHLLLLISVLLVAYPAFSQSCPSTRWPACTILYEDGDDVEDERSTLLNYTIDTLPVCDSDAYGETVYANDSSAGDCATDGGSTWVLCGCTDADAWSAVGGSGAPTDVNYLVGTADDNLSAEIVVGETPGGDLQGGSSSWASPQITNDSHTHRLDNIADPSGDSDFVLGASENVTITSTDNGANEPTLVVSTTRSAGSGAYNATGIRVNMTTERGCCTVDGIQVVLRPSVNDDSYSAAIRIDSEEDVGVLGHGVILTSSGGAAISTGFNASDAAIVDAINIGDNIFATTSTDITAADFDTVFGGAASDADAQHTHTTFDTPSAARFLAGDGTEELPAFSFTNDPDTGLILPYAGALDFVASGAKRLRMGTGTITFYSKMRADANGVVDAPDYSFTDDTETGIYQVTDGDGDIDFTSGGVHAATLDAAALTLAGGLYVPGPSLFEGAIAHGAEIAFANGDTTPDVSGGRHFKTDTNTGLTITGFDAGAGSIEDGHRITVRTAAPLLTYDCSGGIPLNCGGTDDFITYGDDVTEWYYDSTGFEKWNLAGWMNGGLYGPRKPFYQAIYLDGIAGTDFPSPLNDPSTGDGLIWVDDNTDPTRFYFRDDDGNDHRIAYNNFDRECQRSITTEEVGDILMCGKALYPTQVVDMNCVALGDTVPDDQTIEVVYCTSDGASCQAFSPTALVITADALEFDFPSAAIGGTAVNVTQGLWWGGRFASLGVSGDKADFLHCQVRFREPS